MSETTIPQVSPLASYQARAAEIDEAVGRVMRSGYYLLGPETAAFEQEFARFIGGEGVATSSGTDALRLLLAGCGIGPGDEVITVSHTAVATVAAIELVGARPVMIDIDPKSFCLNPARLEAALTERTRAVVPVHLYGHPADLDSDRGVLPTAWVALDRRLCAGARGMVPGPRGRGSRRRGGV